MAILRLARRGAVCLLLAALLPVFAQAQTMNASISGTVLDPTGAAVPNAELTLTGVVTGALHRTTSGPDGLYSFPNLTPGVYELKATAPGFRDFVQRGISLTIAMLARLDVHLELGTAVQTVEVTANASPLNFETAERKEGITPDTLAQLPLLVSGGPRSSATFAILMPGVTTGGSNSAYDARINGGLQSGDEAVMDGVSMQQGHMSQTGMVSIFQDFPVTPDMASELKVLTSNYEPQYGATTSAQIVAVTKSGTNEYHVGAYEYHRNTVLNARQFNAYNRVDDNGKEIPGSARPKDIEHDIGFYAGGPFRIKDRGVPLFWSGNKKSYFYVNHERFRIRGGVSRPTITIPSLKERQGDFTDWRDSSGNLIPIYDPLTTRPNPAYDPGQPVGPTNLPYLRDQFMGCDGATPNVICMSGPNAHPWVENSLYNGWFQYLPNPTSTAAVNNYVSPIVVPDTILAQSNYWLIKGDQYIGDKDHIAVTIWYQGAPPKFDSILPHELANETFSAPQYSNVDRANWDHTFSPTVLNHFAFGYLNRNEGYGSVNNDALDKLPKISGVAAHDNPPVISFSDGFAQFGEPTGTNTGSITTRPTYVANDLLTWVKGKHTLKLGMEYRNIGGNLHSHSNQSGSFYFSRGATGLQGLPSGSPIASFLLGAVDSGNVNFYAVNNTYVRSDAWIWHVGDTWKATPKLSINFGVRWDMFRPTVEKFDQTSFFDPLGANTAAAGRLGRLAFAGNKWGTASFGRRAPEYTFKRGFGPRLGIAYSLNPKTVVRTGYGIFYTQAFMPGWGGGVSQDGFNANVSFGSSLAGMQPAFLLQEGFPPVPADKLPPFIDVGFRNGQSPNYRPFDANRLSYSQQWNLTIEHQFTNDFYISSAYVGTKGTRLPSTTARLNALNPSLLSMGTELDDEFAPGQTELHGVPIPYDGWVEQMTGCAPTVAQALLPYPQYCSGLQGLNENAGNSTYHSFQFKAEKRFSHGTFLLASYTLSKTITSSDHTQRDALTWSGAHGVISPFERQRNKALALDDVPQVLSVAFVYELPFGKGKRWVSGGGVANKVVGGWQVSSVFRASSGIPLFFRSSTCNVPWQFGVGCIPAIKPGANPWAQSKSDFDPNKPLFNKDAFEAESEFNYYYGKGPRISNLRGFPFYNHDVALVKNTRITERLNFQLRAEFFNLWNWHAFTGSGEWGYGAFNTDIASTDFGLWNGTISRPRNIQVGARLDF